MFSHLTAVPNHSPLHFQLLQLSKSHKFLYTACQPIRESKSQAFLLTSAVWSCSLLHDWVLLSVTLGCWLFNQDVGAGVGTVESCPAWQGNVIFWWELNCIVELDCLSHPAYKRHWIIRGWLSVDCLEDHLACQGLAEYNDFTKQDCEFSLYLKK